MSITQHEIYEACQRGELFTIDNVRIVSMETTRPPGCNRAQIGCLVRVGSNKESVLNDVDLDNIHIYKKPKHDPCRLFKEGDRVSPMFWNKRPPVASEERVNSEFMPEDGVYEVLAGEKNSIVYIDYYGKRVFIPACHLELVTPVEEQESFGVRYSTDRDCAEVYHRRYKNTVAAFYCKCGITREQAEEAAEAERDRLNEQYRKEQE